MQGVDPLESIREYLPSGLQNAEIAGLNDAWIDESCRLYGPPGTGKTTEAGLRTAARAVNEGLSPEDVSFATYRRALAHEMLDRLTEWGVFESADDAMPITNPEHPFHHWGTGHAVGFRCARFGERFPDSEDTDEDSVAGMCDNAAERAFCDEYDLEWMPANSRFRTRWTTFRELYAYSRNNCLNIGFYTNVSSEHIRPLQSDVQAGRKLAEFHDVWGSSVNFDRIVTLWEEWKTANGVYDFWEILDASLAGRLPPMQHVVIDEYHDVFPLMALVFERWVENAETVIVCGDPDQVCNSFSGADPAFWEALPDRVNRELPEILLQESHRCADEHFIAASRVLSSERTPPRIATNGPGAITRHYPDELKRDGADWVLPTEHEEGTPEWFNQHYDDVMFLARTQLQCDGIAACLDRHGVIYDAQDGVGGDWDRRIRVIRALRVVQGAAPTREVMLSEEYTERAGSVSANDVPESATLHPAEARTLIRHSHSNTLQNESKIRELVRDCSAEGESVKLQDIAEYVTDSWWSAYGSGPESVHELVGLRDRDKEAMEVAWHRYDVRLSRVEPEASIWTIHASKGQQAADVVVFDGITERIRDAVTRFPVDAENEARTWYVALTRASERMHIVRDAFPWTHSFLPDDLEPWSARQAKLARVNRSGAGGGVDA